MPSPTSLSRGLPETTQASCSPHHYEPLVVFYRCAHLLPFTGSSRRAKQLGALTICSRLQGCWAAAAPLPLGGLCLFPSSLEDPFISAVATEAGR